MIRDKSGVEIRNRISTSHVRSVLSGGHQRDLIICVEDEFARALLIEGMRIKKKELLKLVHIYAIGDKDAVREATSLLNKLGKNSIAVRDADVGEHAVNRLFAFPGTRPPEVEVFSNETVKEAITSKFDIDMDWVLQRDDVKDHHKIAKCIAKEVSSTEEIVRAHAIDIYLSDIGISFEPLIQNIQDALK